MQNFTGESLFCFCILCVEYLQCIHIWCLRRPKGVKDGCEHPCGCWEPSPYALPEQQVLLTSELCLQPLKKNSRQPVPSLLFFFLSEPGAHLQARHKLLSARFTYTLWDTTLECLYVEVLIPGLPIFLSSLWGLSIHKINFISGRDLTNQYNV